MANKFYGATVLTGGGNGSLDGIDGAVLADGDGAFVINASNVLYIYMLDASSAAAESSPDVIKPDASAGNKRWILCDIRGDSIDASTDFTIGGTVITNATITDDGTLVIAATTAVQITGGDLLLIGENDIASGLIRIFGNAANSGGSLELFTGATSDTDIAKFGIIVSADDLLIGPDTDTDALKFIGNGAAVTIQATVAFDVDAALTATTVDADTDFTVGDTVITDGVITDTTNLQIVTGTLTISGTAETLATFVDDGACTFYYDNAVKLATQNLGITVTGDVACTTVTAGTDLTVGDTVITDGVITDTTNLQIVTGTLTITGTGETLATFVDDGACTFYYDNAVKLATQNLGITVTGDVACTTVTAATDLTVGGTVITDATITDDDLLTIVNAGGVRFTDSVGANESVIWLGTANSQRGELHIYGDATYGGVLRIYIDNDDDAVTDYFMLQASGANLYIGAANDTDMFKLLGGAAPTAQFTVALTGTEIIVDSINLNDRAITFSGAGQAVINCADGQNIALEGVTFDDGVIAGASSFNLISDAIYGGGWDDDTTNAPSKNAVYDKIEALGGGHVRLHAMTDALDHYSNYWKVFYSDGAGEIQELALGAVNKVLTAQGAAAAPTWEDAQTGTSVPAGVFTIGTADTNDAAVTLYSDNADEGPQIDFIVPPNADGDGTTYFRVEVVADDLLIGADNDFDMLKFIGGATPTIQSTVAFDVDAACTATTFDADTDFTVGDTVITDGVITDTTNLQIVTGTLTISGTAETLATFVDDGACTFYYDNAVKLATQNLGVTVTGDVACTTVTAGTDLTVGGTVITDATITDDDLLTIVNAGGVRFTDSVGANESSIWLGTANAQRGELHIYGDATYGGILRIYMDNDDDAVTDYFMLQGSGANLYIGGSNDTDMLKLLGGAAPSIQATVAFDVDAALTATTIDADTDFTVGDTVITDGVITDTTNLQIITGTLTISGTAETLATFVDDGACTFYYDNAVKLATQNLGITVTGDVACTTVTAATDLTVNGLVLTADTITNDAALAIVAPNITLTGSAETMAIFTDDGSCAFYHDNVKVLETLTDGINIGDGTDVCPVTYANATDTLTFTCAIVDINGASKATTYDADTDFTVGGTTITDGNIDDDGVLDIDAVTSVTISGGVLYVGVNDTQYGSLRIYGHTSGAQGGELELYLSDDHDATIDLYAIEVVNDDLRIGPNNDSDALTYDGGNTGWHFTDGGSHVKFSTTVLMDDGVKHEWDTLPSADTECTGDISSETVDTNAVGIGALLVMAADGHWDEADADAAATCGLLGLAVEAGTTTKDVLWNGWIHMAAHGFTVGAQLFVHTTQGLMTNTAPSGSGDIVQVVGYATDANTIRFNPSSDFYEVT